jgi:hypothetical protein
VPFPGSVPDLAIPVAVKLPQSALGKVTVAGSFSQAIAGRVHGVHNSETYRIEGLREIVGSHGSPPGGVKLVKMIFLPGVPGQDSKDVGDGFHVVAGEKIASVAEGRIVENIVQLIEKYFLKARSEIFYFLEKFRIEFLKCVGR